MLMIAGVFVALITFCAATKRSVQVAMTIAALGAAALAHSASRIASPSSPFTPGFVQLLGPDGGAGCIVVSEPPVYPDKPRTDRKVVQSLLLYRLVSSIRYMVWPWPVRPAAKAGLKL